MKNYVFRSRRLWYLAAGPGLAEPAAAFYRRNRAAFAPFDPVQPEDFFTAAGSMKYEPFVAYYGLDFKEAIHVDIMMKYTMVEEGAYEVMVVYATDGLNRRANLTVLEDDRHFFPDYYGTILVREDVFERFADEAPGLEDTLTLLNGRFTDELMSELTYRVDVEGRAVDDVAREFLLEQGLLS